MNTLAWNNKTGFGSYFVGFENQGMINRDSWGHSYLGVRGEILRFPRDELLRKHLTQDVLINQERKLGDRRRSDTVVVLTINDTD